MMTRETMEKVAAYVRQHSEENLTLSILAKEFHYSPYHLSRTFKMQMGFSLKQYMEALKMEAGIKGIVEEQQTITHSSLEAGYDSLGSFSNTFKRHTGTGLSPKRYLTESTKAYDFILKQLDKRQALLHRQNPDLRTDNQLTVTVSYPEGYESHITCIGLFRTRIPKEEPILGVALSQLSSFTFDNIPDGEYYLLACELLEDIRFSKTYVLDSNFRQGSDEPLHFSGQTQASFSIELRRPIDSDPPITINLPVLIRRSLIKQAQFRIRKILP